MSISPKLPLAFERNKKGFLSSVLLAILSGLLLLHPSPILKILAIISFALSFAINIFLIKNLHKPAITIDDNGIQDNSSIFPGGRLNWKEVELTDIYENGPSLSLAIIPKDPNYYVNTLKTSTKLMWKTIGKMNPIGTPHICINQSTIKNITIEELKSLIDSKLT